MARKSRKQTLTAVERAELAVVNHARPWFEHPLVQGAAAVGKIADQPPLLALSGLVMAAGLVRRDVKLARTGARMTLAHVLATAVKTVAKNNLDRTRPKQHLKDGSYQRRIGTSDDPSLRSFPSGHTAGAVALSRAIGREYPGSALAVDGISGAIGLLQVPRRAHFPTDVVAGALIGIAAEAVVNGAVKLVWQRGSADRTSAPPTLPAPPLPSMMPLNTRLERDSRSSIG